MRLQDMRCVFYLLLTSALWNAWSVHCTVTGDIRVNPQLRTTAKKDDFALCKLKKAGMHFEVICHPGMILKFREGLVSDVMDVVVSSDIFKDAKTRMHRSHVDIVSAFGKEDITSCIKEILMEGEYQHTAEERKRQMEEKMEEVAAFICQNFVETPSHRAYSMEEMMEILESHPNLKFNPMRSTEYQAMEVVKQLQEDVPIVPSYKSVACTEKFKDFCHAYVEDCK
ncbi:hypothetical protein GUITHDRAFT_163179 [Guillardia theta CCMP2712]|uniref:Ribosome maturation protein SDO1/SBDS N-terminal domain-containing protein n=3 Tax=Guillardia theta TaxID=55529 RepID=L1JCT5_GUITC|nr:hypothetical protein GUITHDRAFT_163179 [Guillardia theta CCMP2712]EKX45934.1 hypothetical protein GUITHDRAFT_163179 [Guillardia theta CCMP2712]|eukprot:XP_005832914.1 hypothetical protein GUITHDRAFT_163179 [Guillardia theta CCMP2712]